MIKSTVKATIGNLIFKKGNDVLDQWKVLITSALNQLNTDLNITDPDQQYLYYQAKDMNGTALFLFCRRKMV